MKRTKQILMLLTVLFLNYTGNAQKKNQWYQYKDVSEAGFSKAKLDSVSIAYDQMNSEAFLVIYKGKVLLSLGDPSRRFMCHSIRKSFMSAMYGIYLEKGHLSLDKSLRELGIQDHQTLSDVELDATVEHLISARSGIYHPAAYEPRSMKENRPDRGSAKPGEAFFYNNWDFNTLVSIFNQETNQDFFEAFVKDIATPIGMEDLRMEDMNYRNEPDQSMHPAYLFKMSSRDLARFGQLYLNNGKWNGKRIIPEGWINESTSIKSVPETFRGRDGYGYLWWIDNHSFGEKAYYASGLGGHLMYVLPESEMVIVHRVNTYLMIGERQEKINQLINMVLNAQTEKSSKKPKLVPFKPERPSINQVALTKDHLQQFTGSYKHRFFEEMNVYLDGDELKVKGEILGDFKLIPLSKNKFQIEDVPELPLYMEKADDEQLSGQAVTEVDENRIPVKITLYY